MSILTAEALQLVTVEKAFPINFAWSRLEGRPRTNNFDRALKAEVRDALWMLTRQWQMGEFQGDDCGSPVSAKLSTTTSLLDKYKAGDHGVQTFDNDMPLEAKVEQRRLPFTTLQQNISLDLRLLMGRRWMQLLTQKGLQAARPFFLTHYAIAMPDPTRKEDAALCSDAGVWQQFAAVAGRMIDGAQLYLDLKKAVTPHYYDIPGFPLPGKEADFDTVEQTFITWFEALYCQPETEEDAWKPEQLEYQFAISTPAEQGEKVMTAKEYYQGHLDWYNVDIAPAGDTLGDVSGAPPAAAPVKKVSSLIPAPVMFEGMPNTRWWAFEEGRTNFGFVKPDTTDLAKLLLVEFGLIYANDWYLIPYTLPAGSLTRIKGLSLTNVFGEKFWIEAAGKGSNTDWKRWNMFSMHVNADTPAPADIDLLLLPTVAKIQQGKPAEEIAFVRDEMANMVWGVETRIPLPTGGSRPGGEAASAYHNFLQKLIPVPAPVPAVMPDPNVETAAIRYEVMNTIPENWIPFVPAHVTGNNREVQLQRGAMPRILDNDPDKPDKIRPRTDLLQGGLEAQQPYYVHEEEVSRAGIRVTQSYQRARWNNGEVFVWYGVHKTTGRGEGSSGLGFDRIVEKIK